MYNRTMDVTRALHKAAALIGEPSRAAMLWSLLGGESRPACELAMLANVSPQTTSNHLKLLSQAGFLKIVSRGRNKFYSLSGPPIAEALESLAAAANIGKYPQGLARHHSPELIFARTCYDHLAGELGVAILSGLLRMQYLEEHSANYRVTSKGQAFITALGIDVSAALSRRRRFAYPCLDWSERVPHLGGALGAALLRWLLRSESIAPMRNKRAVRLTHMGQKQLAKHFSLKFAPSGALISDSDR
jgi:DNA-binding transcriptional ArsR family regulator